MTTMKYEDIPHAKLEAAAHMGPAAFVSGSEEALSLWTDEEYAAVFDHPKPKTLEDFAEVSWYELNLFLEEDYTPNHTNLVNLPGAVENRERLAAWAATRPELRQLQGDERGLAFIYLNYPDKFMFPPEDPRALYTKPQE